MMEGEEDVLNDLSIEDIQKAGKFALELPQFADLCTYEFPDENKADQIRKFVQDEIQSRGLFTNSQLLFELELNCNMIELGEMRDKKRVFLHHEFRTGLLIALIPESTTRVEICLDLPCSAAFQGIDPDFNCGTVTNRSGETAFDLKFEMKVRDVTSELKDATLPPRQARFTNQHALIQNEFEHAVTTYAVQTKTKRREFIYKHHVTTSLINQFRRFVQYRIFRYEHIAIKYDPQMKSFLVRHLFPGRRQPKKWIRICKNAELSFCFVPCVEGGSACAEHINKDDWQELIQTKVMEVTGLSRWNDLNEEHINLLEQYLLFDCKGSRITIGTSISISIDTSGKLTFKHKWQYYRLCENIDRGCRKFFDSKKSRGCSACKNKYYYSGAICYLPLIPAYVILNTFSNVNEKDPINWKLVACNNITAVTRQDVNILEVCREVHGLKSITEAREYTSAYFLMTWLESKLSGVDITFVNSRVAFVPLTWRRFAIIAANEFGMEMCFRAGPDPVPYQPEFSIETTFPLLPWKNVETIYRLYSSATPAVYIGLKAKKLNTGTGVGDNIGFAKCHLEEKKDPTRFNVLRKAAPKELIKWEQIAVVTDPVKCNEYRVESLCQLTYSLAYSMLTGPGTNHFLCNLFLSTSQLTRDFFSDLNVLLFAKFGKSVYFKGTKFPYIPTILVDQSKYKDVVVRLVRQ